MNEGGMTALGGVRVIEIGGGIAGAYCGKLCADFGAGEADLMARLIAGCDVLIVAEEAVLPEAIAAKQFEKSHRFCALNRGKRSTSLDLTSQAGLELARQLVGQCDAVIENQAAGVMPRLGLGYDHLKAVNPALVMVSMSAFASGNALSATRGVILPQGLRDRSGSAFCL